MFSEWPCRRCLPGHLVCRKLPPSFRRRPWRPRRFERAVACARAMHVVWEKGYEGAALSDLTRAMRINRPSLYAAFGNKEQLFRKVLDRYASGPLAYFGKALAAAKARDVVEG